MCQRHFMDRLFLCLLSMSKTFFVSQIFFSGRSQSETLNETFFLVKRITTAPNLNSDSFFHLLQIELFQFFSRAFILNLACNTNSGYQNCTFCSRVLKYLYNLLLPVAKYFCKPFLPGMKLQGLRELVEIWEASLFCPNIFIVNFFPASHL